MNKEDKTYNQRISDSGIKTLYPDGINCDTIINWNTVIVKLEYNGKTIIRPNAESVIRVVKKEFNLDI